MAWAAAWAAAWITNPIRAQPRSLAHNNQQQPGSQGPGCFALLATLRTSNRARLMRRQAASTRSRTPMRMLVTTIRRRHRSARSESGFRLGSTSDSPLRLPPHSEFGHVFRVGSPSVSTPREFNTRKLFDRRSGSCLLVQKISAFLPESFDRTRERLSASEKSELRPLSPTTSYHSRESPNEKTRPRFCFCFLRV